MSVIVGLRLTMVGLFWIIFPMTAYLVNALLDAIDGPFYKHYLKLGAKNAQKIDKALDLWMYTGAMIYSLQYPFWFTDLLLVLYFYRLVGQVIFFFRGRRVFVYFPNMFEIFYIIFYAGQLWRLDGQLHDRATLTVIIIAVFTGKVIHEYTLHRKEKTVFDNIIRPVLGVIGR